MSNISQELSNAVEEFLTLEPTVTAHMDSTANPHSVTKTQVGLGNVDNIKQATEAQLEAHTDDTSNPHSVTKTQVGLGSVDNTQQATKTEFDAHTGNTSNPHSVTKTQVGLGSVDNAQQATKTAYDAHVAGSADKHTGDDVLYDVDQNKSVTARIDEIVIGSGSGTYDHTQLLNRNSPSQHEQKAIVSLADDIGIVFTGTCTGGGSCELLASTSAGYSLINSDGRLEIPENSAMAFKLEVISLGKLGNGNITRCTALHTEGGFANRGGTQKITLAAFSSYELDSAGGTGAEFTLTSTSSGTEHAQILSISAAVASLSSTLTADFKARLTYVYTEVTA